MVDLRFINVTKKSLTRLVSHFWVARGSEFDQEEHLLLPMDHVDLIITLGGEYIYNHSYRADRIHFHGIRERAVCVQLRGEVYAIGVSFTPWGFYAITESSMIRFKNRIVDLSEVDKNLLLELDSIKDIEDIEEQVAIIEEALEKQVCGVYMDEFKVGIIEELIYSDIETIKKFCELQNISVRRLERIFSQYIGISPKKFLKIMRFENSARDIIDSPEMTLTELSAESEYFDQSHFIRDFKVFSGYSPKKFKVDEPAQKQHFKYK